MATDAQDPVHGVRLVVSLYREFEQVARKGDLSMAQYRTLLYLLGGSRRAGELAAANAVTKPTVSAMINGLRQQGWVADAADETGDGRVTRVELTGGGTATARALRSRAGRTHGRAAPRHRPDPGQAVLRRPPGSAPQHPGRTARAASSAVSGDGSGRPAVPSLAVGSPAEALAKRRCRAI